MAEDLFIAEVDEASLRRLRRGFAAVHGWLSDVRPLGPVLHEEWFAPMVSEQFATEGGRSGGWKPLKPAYAEAKEDKYGSLPIMQLPDRTLLRSLTDRTAEGAILDARAGEITFGSSVVYAGRQHAERPLVDPTEDDERKLIAITARELSAVAAAEGFEVL